MAAAGNVQTLAVSGDITGDSERHDFHDMACRQEVVFRNSCGSLTRSIVSISAAAILLCGCMIEGDFGRPKPSLLHQKLNKNVAYVRDFFLDESPEFSLTADELELRDAAYYFNESLPVYALSKRSLLEGGTYADHLTTSGYKVGQAKLKTISAQINADRYWLRRFARAVRRIMNSDAERQAQLRISSHVLSDNDRARIFSRIKENRLLVHTTLRDLEDRLASYGYAIERSRIEHPGASIQKVEMSINQLREIVSRLRTEISRFQRYVAPKPWELYPVSPKRQPYKNGLQSNEKSSRDEKDMWMKDGQKS